MRRGNTRLASISTMPLAKGLDFRAVLVMAFDDEIIRSQARIDSVADEADLAEVYNTERHVLYVVHTGARLPSRHQRGAVLRVSRRCDELLLCPRDS